MAELNRKTPVLPENDSADVVIDGKVLTLTGSDPSYLQQVAAYIDETIAGLKKERILSRKSAEHRAMMVYLKLADDCLKARAALAAMNEEMSSREGDVYTLKRELVEKRVEAERSREQLAAEKDRQKNAQADLKKELEDAQAAKAKAVSLEAELKSVKEAAFSLEAELAEAKAARDAAEAKAAKLEADLNELLAH